MRRTRSKTVLYGILFLVGLTWVGFGYRQHQYANLIETGNQAVREQRFDDLAYERARTIRFANDDTLLFNQGVQAYQAGHLPRAMEHFRHVSQHSRDARIRQHALYNLGMVLLELDDAQGAEEFFKATLRLDPQDRDTKFVLEQLYHTLLRHMGSQREAASEHPSTLDPQAGTPLKQAPGLNQEHDDRGDDGGQGRSQPPGGI